MPTVFRAKTNEGYILKILAELLHNNIRTACLRIDSDGITVRMMDSNRFVLLDVVLRRASFNVYELNVPELHIGVNLSHFFKMLKSVKKKDAVMISVDDSEIDSLILTVFPKEGSRTDDATIRTQPTQHIAVALPDNYSNPVNIGSNDFQPAVKNIASISDSLVLRMRQYSLEVSSNSQDSIYTKRSHLGEEEDKTPEHYVDSFNMEQFTRILKISSLSDTIQVFAGSADKPLLIRTAIGSLGVLSVFIKSQRQIQQDEK